MPLDDLSFDLTPPRQASADDAPAALAPSLEMMTRALRLPTLSKRQARSIVRMQLDRLSPLPVTETLFDVVLIRPQGAEGLWALGLTRKAALLDPAFAATAVMPVVTSIDGAEVVFRFRNPGAVSDRETRWLRHAPAAAVIAAGLAAIALAGDIRSDQWRTLRLPEIAENARTANRLAKDARDRAAARADWTGMERADASTRLLCVLSRVKSAVPDRVAVIGLAADTASVQLVLPNGADPTPLVKAGAVAPARPPVAAGTPQSGVSVAFSGSLCG